MSRTLAQLRAELGLSREKFAAHVGIKTSAVWRIENRGVAHHAEVVAIQQHYPNYVAPSELPAQTSPGTQTTAPVSVTLVDVKESTEDVLPAPADEKIIQTAYFDAELPKLPPELSPSQMSLNDGVRRFSNSEIQTFKDCRRRWWLAYYRKLVPKYESPVGARAVGDRIHRALRWMYIESPEHRRSAVDALEILIEMDRRRLMATHTESVSNEADAPFIADDNIIKQFNAEANLERVMVQGYVDWVEETGADADFELTGSERYLEADLPGMEKVKIIARIDARLQRISDGVRFFLDHKTVGDLTQPLRTLPLDEQMLWYILIERLQPAETTFVAGALYNMIKRSKRTAKAKPPFYRRVPVYHNETEINHFLERLRGTIHDVLVVQRRLDDGESHREVVYPRPTRDCTWKCNYFDLCRMIDDGSNATGYAVATYRVGDPLSYYVKDTSSATND